MADAKDLTLRFLKEVFENRNLDVVDELVAADSVDYTPLPGQPAGAAGLRWQFETLFAAFPDFRVDIDDVIAQGDRVAVRSTAHGTHKGEFMGMPATGKHVSNVGGIDIVTVRDGKFVEHWGYWDQGSMLTQLGVLPPPPA